MALSKQEILDAVAGMTVLDLSDLIKMMEEKFGVSAAAAAVSVAAAPAAAAAAVEEQTEFTVVLAAVGEKKVEVIKVVRAATGPKEAGSGRRCSEGGQGRHHKADAAALKKQLADAGAKVELK
jgi:large subunit ribosomal protein L7/L12